MYVPPSFNSDKSGIYIRCEPELKILTEIAFDDIYKSVMSLIKAKQFDNPELSKMLKRIKNKYDVGLTTHEVNEVMDKIRRKTFIDRNKMNPSSHIPVMNGLLNLETFELEPFTPDLFYTWKVQGNYDEKIKSLNDVPQFRNFLYSVFDEKDIPMVLDYGGYIFYPDLPIQKILVLAGEPRIGKGTTIRILENAIPEGHATITIRKLLNPKITFEFQNIEGKNLLVDPEIERDNGIKLNFSLINSLFGGDTLQLEKKFKGITNYISRAKGILAGNIPLFYVTNPAFLARLLIVKTRMKSKGFKETPNLDRIIWEAEGSKIVSLLLNRLKGLIKRNFKFSNQQPPEYYSKLWELMCDTIKQFMDKRLMYSESDSVDVDNAYDAYKLDCESKGIPAEAQHTFVARVGKPPYSRKKLMDNGKYHNVFYNCKMILIGEMDEDALKHNHNMDFDEI